MPSRRRRDRGTTLPFSSTRGRLYPVTYRAPESHLFRAPESPPSSSSESDDQDDHPPPYYRRNPWDDYASSLPTYQGWGIYIPPYQSHGTYIPAYRRQPDRGTQEQQHGRTNEAVHANGAHLVADSQQQQPVTAAASSSEPTQHRRPDNARAARKKEFKSNEKLTGSDKDHMDNESEEFFKREEELRAKNDEKAKRVKFVVRGDKKKDGGAGNVDEEDDNGEETRKENRVRNTPLSRGEDRREGGWSFVKLPPAFVPFDAETSSSVSVSEISEMDLRRRISGNIPSR